MKTHPWSEVRDRGKDSPERTAAIAEIRRAMEVVIQLERPRTERGMTQTELAGVLSVAQNAVSTIRSENFVAIPAVFTALDGQTGKVAQSACRDGGTRS